jgi:hypothetical protein
MTFLTTQNAIEDQISCSVCYGDSDSLVGKYTELAKEKYGPNFDVIREPFDPDVVYKARCGKKHGHHFLADGYIDSWVSASQSRSRSSATEDSLCHSK